MPRWLLTGVFLVLASSWSNSAFAQYGGMGGNTRKDPIEEIDSQRTKQKQQHKTYAKAIPRATAPPRSYFGNPASRDAYGRIDMSGRPAPGYPTVRGDFTGPTTISPIRARPSTAHRRNSAVTRRTPLR